MLEESGSGMVRLRNGQVVFDRFVEAGTDPISRAEIARLTGLSKPTVNALVLDFEAAGVVRCNPSVQPHGRIGRPAASYEVVPDAALVVGVDMGATKTIIGVADLLGDVIATEQIETPAHAVAAVNAVVTAIRAPAGAPRRSGVKAGGSLHGSSRGLSTLSRQGGNGSQPPRVR